MFKSIAFDKLVEEYTNGSFDFSTFCKKVDDVIYHEKMASYNEGYHKGSVEGYNSSYNHYWRKHNA